MYNMSERHTIGIGFLEVALVQFLDQSNLYHASDRGPLLKSLRLCMFEA